MILAVVQDREQIQMKQYELTSRQEMALSTLFVYHSEMALSTLFVYHYNQWSV